MRRSARQQRGIALLTALLVVAIASILAVGIISRAHVEFRRSETLLFGAQAMQYTLGAEQWVQEILRRDREEFPVDHAGQPWASRLPPLPVDGGTVQGRLADLNGRFNLANLVTADGEHDAAAIGQLQRLIEILGLDDRLAAEAIVDWVDPDVETTLPDGAEDPYYLGLDTPYRAPNRHLAATDELRLVRGMDAEAFAVLAPHVAALPGRTALNVNTATVPVLMSLGSEISAAAAEAAFAATREDGFGSLDAFRSMLDGIPDPDIDLGLASSHFQLTTRVEIGTVRLTMYSLIERGERGTRVIARSRTPLHQVE